MGVDIGTYRCRIGTFRHGSGIDVILLRICVNYIGCLKMVGAVTFIGLLLLMAGVEANPGPLDPPTVDGGEDAIYSILKQLGLDTYISNFKDNMIGVNEVGDVTNDDFTSIGIPIGARIRIQKACKQHVNGFDQINMAISNICSDTLPISAVSNQSLAKEDVNESIDTALNVSEDNRGLPEFYHRPCFTDPDDSNQDQLSSGRLVPISTVFNESLAKEFFEEGNIKRLNISDDNCEKAESDHSPRSKDTVNSNQGFAGASSTAATLSDDTLNTSTPVSPTSLGSTTCRALNPSTNTLWGSVQHRDTFGQNNSLKEDSTDVSQDNQGEIAIASRPRQTPPIAPKPVIKGKTQGVEKTMDVLPISSQSLPYDNAHESNKTTLTHSEKSRGHTELAQRTDLNNSSGSNENEQKCKLHNIDLQRQSSESFSDAQTHVEIKATDTEQSNTITTLPGVNLNKDLDEEMVQMQEEMRQMQLTIDRENKIKKNDEMRQQLEEMRRSSTGITTKGQLPLSTVGPTSTVSDQSFINDVMQNSGSMTSTVTEENSGQAESHNRHQDLQRQSRESFSDAQIHVEIKATDTEQSKTITTLPGVNLNKDLDEEMIQMQEEMRQMQLTIDRENKIKKNDEMRQQLEEMRRSSTGITTKGKLPLSTIGPTSTVSDQSFINDVRQSSGSMTPKVAEENSGQAESHNRHQDLQSSEHFPTHVEIKATYTEQSNTITTLPGVTLNKDLDEEMVQMHEEMRQMQLTIDRENKIKKKDEMRQQLEEMRRSSTDITTKGQLHLSTVGPTSTVSDQLFINYVVQNSDSMTPKVTEENSGQAESHNRHQDLQGQSYESSSGIQRHVEKKAKPIEQSSKITKSFDLDVNTNPEEEMAQMKEEIRQPKLTSDREKMIKQRDEMRQQNEQLRRCSITGEDDICKVLKKNGFGEYIQIFKENMIRLNDVEKMSADDFQSIGITALGIRLRIQDACKKHLKGEDDICKVLKKNGLDEYIQIFKENMIRLFDVEKMSTDDFQSIGITALGIRLRIQDACKQHLKGASSTAATLSDDTLTTSTPESTTSVDTTTCPALNPITNTLGGSVGKPCKDSLPQTTTAVVSTARTSRQSAVVSVKTTNLGTDNQGEIAIAFRPRQPPPKAPKPIFKGHTQGAEKTLHDSGNSENDLRSSNGVQNTLFALLKRLELTQWFPGKISQKDVTAIDVNESLSETKCISNLPWLILKRLIMANTHARDSTVDELVHGYNDNSSTDDDDSEGSEETDELCPLDVFIALFHCCDSLLKQSIYKKMFMCRFAVPLLYKDHSSGTFIVPVWPLRPIVVEWMDSKRKSNEDFIIDQHTKIIAFARFGRPKYSKSKLQNDLLSEHKHDTIFNKDCPSGMSERSLSIGYVEASWYLPGGNVSDVFDEVLTFANVRGDLLNDFSENQIKFIQSLATMFVIVLDIQSFRKNINRVMQFLEPLQSLVLIITPTDNEKDTDFNECARELKEKTETKGKEVHIVLTYKKRKERNASDMKKTLRAHIDTCLKNTRSTQLSVCFGQLSKFEIRSDEKDPECKAGKCLAETLFNSILQSGPQEDWKSAVTPLQYTYWRKWSELKKTLQRSFNHIDDTEQTKCQMNALRRSQLQMVSETMKLFIKIFVKHVDQKHTILYFIEWLKLFLDNMSRGLLPSMRRNYNIAWDNLKQMESESEVNSEAVSNQVKIVKRLEESLEGASFGIEHLFREMSQIYEAELSANKSNPNKQEITNTSKAMAKLISYGQSFELLDGDASNIPTDWVNSVLVAVKDLIGCERIMTLSVLGIQSSGKSTLLNTMFGLQFAVSAGRCTRGVYMQLVPIAKSSGLPFDHVMVIDSEGLRAPELLEQKKDHDNELATFVIGLGDITLLNIKGENTSEINDILQITVHAFLRLKASNRKLDLRQICIFVHQNVAAINAADKMKHGVQKLVECLDKMTTEAAYGENIHDITCFNQVIQFDGTKHVWYLPDLWQGDPPMAAANVGYSTKVKDLRTSILQIAISDKEKSYKCMDDILIHAKDLWKGICAEDFVFSFKNSLEIKAYLLMETKYKQLAWQLESFAQVETQERSKTAFSKCQSDDDVETTSETVLKLLLKNVEAKYNQLKTQLDFFFENCDYQDIIINWKQTKYRTLCMLFENLKLSIQTEIKLYASNRKVQIVLTSSRQQQEERLHQESIKLASDLKGKYMKTTDINKEFERIWDIFIQGIKHEKENNFKLVKAICIEILCKIFNTDTSALHAQLEHYNDLDKDLKIEKLQGSSNLIGLKTKDDISIHVSGRFHNWAKGKNAKDQLFDTTNLLFREIDVKIGHILQEDNELGHRHVNNLLQYVIRWIDDTIKSNNSTWGFTLKTSYRVKICVFISCYAQRKFELHNQKYRQSHGPKVQLIRYKAQVRTRFEAYLQERKAEATAANLFSTEVEGFIIENVSERLTLKVEHSLMAFFPNVKYHLIIEILTDLVENGCFKQFIEYIRHPKTYADALNTEKASDYLFDEKSHTYIDLALNEISVIISDIRSGIHKASEQCKTGHSICDWIAFFYDSLSHCTIERERLREVEREKVVDFANFKNYLESEMNKVEASVKQVFVKHTMASVKWKKSNPLTTVFDRIWGCTEACVICGEICARSSDHVGSTSHSCIQHRPAGVNGVHKSKTKEISLTSCNFKIQSDKICKCSVFRYLCNPTEHVECSKGDHPYKEYRTYLPSWDIEPASDMEDTCKLWLWFIAKYRQELASYYECSINNIPDSWQRITKEEALESLRNMFKNVS